MDDVTQRMHQAVESLQENEALTSNLDDEAAQALLDWGSASAQAIAQSTAGLDEAAAEATMDERLQAVRRLLRTVNEHVAATPGVQAAPASDSAEASASPPEWLQEVVAQVAQIEGPAFVPPTAEQLAALASRWAAGAPSPLEIVTELRTLFASSAAPAPAEGDSATSTDTSAKASEAPTVVEPATPPPNPEQQRAWASLWQTISKFFGTSTPNQ
jgi:hypothetical protein